MKIGTIIRNNWTTTKNPSHISIYIGNNKSVSFSNGKPHICRHEKGFQKTKTFDGKIAFEPVGFCDFKSMMIDSYNCYMHVDKRLEIMKKLEG